ncbi:alpha/beta hydrolase [Erythrobacter sp.]|uniref:alpha/beta hydrolase n=1 Tax=Erythrobacter sp. TaxID=1042 RepID=UPI001425CFD7|nr:alpha/beta hydrolase [Erythrobacter sp.]QIQ86860.1 MAG: alpha/beta hydrolase [Erythrobacter sp.]
MSEAAAQETGESSPESRKAAPIDRRAIPPHARETVWTAPDGHDVRRIDWPGAQPPRGSILFLPGRGDHYEKYLEALEEWHRAGWRVTASDWRGQGASGRLGKDAVTGHVEDFAHWVDDLAHLWELWKAETPGPHILAAHSMGGHLSMRALVERRIDPDAVVLSAPMLGMNGPPLPLPALHAIAKTMTRIGDPARQAWKWSEKPGEMPAARNVLLTHDDERYEDEIWWRKHRPELVMGPASWRWLERAYASWRGLEESGALEAVETPVLILSTSADKLVSHSANVRASKRLPNARLVEFGREARHEILREADPVRARAMDAIAAFLDEAARSGN